MLGTRIAERHGFEPDRETPTCLRGVPAGDPAVLIRLLFAVV